MLLNSYLSTRSQRVVLKDSLSQLCDLTADVPQGSIGGGYGFLEKKNSDSQCC
jgi:hypothetical protein